MINDISFKERKKCIFASLSLFLLSFLSTSVCPLSLCSLRKKMSLSYFVSFVCGLTFILLFVYLRLCELLFLMCPPCQFLLCLYICLFLCFSTLIYLMQQLISSPQLNHDYAKLYKKPFFKLLIFCNTK